MTDTSAGLDPASTGSPINRRIWGQLGGNMKSTGDSGLCFAILNKFNDPLLEPLYASLDTSLGTVLLAEITTCLPAASD